MDEENERPGKRGVGTFLLTLIMTSPCFFAWATSAVISRGGPESHSGMWFMYQVSTYLSILGLIVTAVLTVIYGTQRMISGIFVALMGFLVVLGSSVLWYAIHIYRSPWY
jgi:hypothetical protein